MLLHINIPVSNVIMIVIHVHMGIKFSEIMIMMLFVHKGEGAG